MQWHEWLWCFLYQYPFQMVVWYLIVNTDMAYMSLQERKKHKYKYWFCLIWPLMYPWMIIHSFYKLATVPKPKPAPRSKHYDE